MNENTPGGAGKPDFFDAIAEATLMMCLPAAPLQAAHLELSTALKATEGLYPEKGCEFLSSREILLYSIPGLTTKWFFINFGDTA